MIAKVRERLVTSGQKHTSGVLRDLRGEFTVLF